MKVEGISPPSFLGGSVTRVWGFLQVIVLV